MMSETVLLDFGTFVMSVMRCVPTGSGLLLIGHVPIGVPLSLHESHFGTVMSVRKPRSVPPEGICVGPCVTTAVAVAVAVAVTVAVAVAVAVAVTVAVGAVSVAVAVTGAVGAVVVGALVVLAAGASAALNALRAAPNGPFTAGGAPVVEVGDVDAVGVLLFGCDGTTSRYTTTRTIIAAMPDATPTSHIGTPPFAFGSIIVGCWYCAPYGDEAYAGGGARFGSPGLYVGANAAGEYCGVR
jgi:hypothetical protein